MNIHHCGVIYLIAAFIFTGSSLVLAEPFALQSNDDNVCPSIDYRRSHVLIVGALTWKEKGLATFNNEARKDLELYRLFRNCGVPERNMTVLLDRNATLQNIRQSLRKAIDSVKKGDTFIFYYAGHGLKENDTAWFVNYDMDTGNGKTTGFSLNELSKSLLTLKEANVLLLADCCYSGSLMKVCRELSKNGNALNSAFASSADASNESTENWTFTQILIDTLSGKSMGDSNEDGFISLGEFNEEVGKAMRFQERQKNGFGYFGLKRNMVIARVEERGVPLAKANISLIKTISTNATIGSYVMAEDNSTEPYHCGRIVGTRGQKVLVQFYRYNHSVVKAIEPSKIRMPYVDTFKKGDVIRVLQDGKEYDAQVLNVVDGFHFITYPGWSHDWDEWVMSNRIICLKSEEEHRKPCEVKWQGTWYKADVYRQRHGKFFIHYRGHHCGWDEWVQDDRIRFPAEKK